VRNSVFIDYITCFVCLAGLWEMASIMTVISSFITVICKEDAMDHGKLRKLIMAAQ